MSLLSKFSRRGFLKYGSLSGLAAFVTSCLSANAPTASPTAAGTGASAAPTVIARAETITWKVQSGWAGNDIFQELFLDWKAFVEEMSGGRLKIDALPVNAVTNINGAIDAVHSGTLDGAHHVPAYYYGKDHAVSLMGTGPMMGMSGQMWLAWYYYGGGQALYEKLVQTKLKLNVVSLFHMPMQNQPLGWFKNEIKGPDDFKGMKFRTVGLATGIYQGLGASVVSVAGAEVASSLDRGVIDAAEFNNTTSDTVYGGGQALYEKLVQTKLKLNVVSLFHMPMQNQPLGWFKNEIKGPDDFKGMKFRTVGLATGIYQALGASVVSVAGAEVASSLDRSVIDAAEFNNTTSDTVYGLPDVRKVLMARSYHQPSEILEISLNKTKYDAMPTDLKAIMKYAAWAESANGEWKFMDKNSRDYAALAGKNVKVFKTPQSVLDAQLKAWDTVVASESASNPDFVAILDSQKAWAQRVFKWADDINIPTPDPVSYKAFFKT